jgi:hypothetical protein
MGQCTSGIAKSARKKMSQVKEKMSMKPSILFREYSFVNRFDWADTLVPFSQTLFLFQSDFPAPDGAGSSPLPFPLATFRAAFLLARSAARRAALFWLAATLASRPTLSWPSEYRSSSNILANSCVIVSVDAVSRSVAADGGAGSGPS